MEDIFKAFDEVIQKMNEEVEAAETREERQAVYEKYESILADAEKKQQQAMEDAIKADEKLLEDEQLASEEEMKAQEEADEKEREMEEKEKGEEEEEEKKKQEPQFNVSEIEGLSASQLKRKYRKADLIFIANFLDLNPNKENGKSMLKKDIAKMIYNHLQ